MTRVLVGSCSFGEEPWYDMPARIHRGLAVGDECLMDLLLL